MNTYTIKIWFVFTHLRTQLSDLQFKNTADWRLKAAYNSAVGASISIEKRNTVVHLNPLNPNEDKPVISAHIIIT